MFADHAPRKLPPAGAMLAVRKMDLETKYASSIGELGAATPMRQNDQATRLEHRRLWQAIGVVLIVFVTYLSLTPALVDIPVARGDKYGHTFAYAALMFWYAQIYARPGARVGWAITFMTMSMTLEYLQGLTSYRTYDVADIGANMLGICLGWLLAPPRSPHALEFLETRVLR